MKAAVFRSKGDIRVDVNYPTPKVNEYQGLLRVKACGVCGTDVHIHAGAQGTTDCNPPVILGHEFAGEVVEVGSAVKRIKVGDHITVTIASKYNHYCTEFGVIVASRASGYP